MTAILDEIRRLEAARMRGALTDAQFESAKERLMASIEEDNADAPPPVPAPTPKSFRVFDVVMFCLISTMLCIALGTFLFGDLMLAITLAVTLLAAFTIRAFITLDD